MNIRQPPLSSPIEEKIAWAENCYNKADSQFFKDRTIIDLLDRLKKAIQTSHEEMKAAGIVDLCRECERNEGGSCCG
ncbi:MAG: hypothetical protein JRG69_13630, partial [Deltaproteobacteria bacterium]|nr:hypothetical protein [Deltaproteobacteria bacterium]